VVFIGLKPIAAAHTRETRRVPGIVKQEALALRDSLGRVGVKIVRTFQHSAAVVAEIAADRAPALRELPFVDYIEPDEPMTTGGVAAFGALNAAFFTETMDWGLLKVGANSVWNVDLPTTAGANANITIIDTGIDSVHLYSGDGPGNTVLDVRCLYISAPPDITTCFQPATDVHGSHVAGIAAGRSNGTGYIGIAYLPMKVNSIRACAPTIGCPTSYTASALDWTVSNGGPRQVINMSFGGPSTWPTAAYNLLKASYNAGNLLVGITHNNGPNGGNGVFYPAKYPEVVAVSGTSTTDGFAAAGTCPTNLSAYSNYGPETELSAPWWANSMIYGGGFGLLCGSSMAAPLVTGVAALLWSKNTTWTRDQVRTRLQSTAVDLGTAGRDVYFGYGRVDAPRALYGVLTVSVNGPSSPNGTLQTWTADVTNGVSLITYLWERRPYCSSSWSPVGTSSSYSETTTIGDHFFLRATATSVGRTAVSSKLVGGLTGC
jgi:subtilisin family serine protease